MAARKKIEADHKKASVAVAEQIDLLRANGAAADVLDKVNELQKLDNSFKDQVHYGPEHPRIQTQYWATRSFARTAHSFACFARNLRCAHSFARSLTSLTRSLTSLTPSLVGK